MGTPLTTDDVEKYLKRLCQEGKDLMQAYDPQLMWDWILTNLADDAVFQIDIRIRKDGVHKGSVAVTLDKEDILQLGGLFGKAAGENTIADYAIDLNIKEIILHGGDTATANVTWHERIVLQAPIENESQTVYRLTVESDVDCRHLIVRDTDTLALDLTICSGEARILSSN